MRKGFLFLFIVCTVTVSLAQPYVDVLNMRTIQSPDQGLIRRNNHKNSFEYFNASLTLPIRFKKPGGALIISPYVENWQVHLPDINKQASLVTERDQFFPTGIGLPITLLTPIPNSKLLLNMTVILRNNAEKLNLPGSFQAGGYVVMNYKINPKLTLKAGLYYNREAFGNFFMPIAGLEYKIDSTLQMWGALPGSFFLEKKLKKRWYAGVTFKAVNNSYQLFHGKYIQFNDNQLSLFSDFYFTKNLVLNLEAGHSLFRRIRIGRSGSIRQYVYDEKVNDNLLFRVSAIYRIRL
ncbi:hypothetical protein [Lacibacter sp. H407]|uniref:hypothetical protein n=1 Tax=Lacibacter sp. H407 TaxID=3133423 RepID=UPI0030C00103